MIADPQIKRIGDSYFVATPEAALEFSALREHSDGLSAEITATAIVNGATHWSRINLASAVARNGLNKALAVACAPVEWNGLLDTACRLVAKAERIGEPSRLLVAAPPAPDGWLVKGWVPARETTVVYGDGGVAKSFFVTALGLAGLTRRSIGASSRWSVTPLRGVLLLDWESRYEDHAGRLWGFMGDTEPPVNFFYQAMTRPLVDMVSSIRRDIVTHDIDLVIADSLGAACGSEPEGSDAAIRAMNALRSLAPATRIAVAHVSKMAADQAKGSVRPFGSVYVRNLARSTIFASIDDNQAEGELVVTYTHTKVNTGPKQAPAALRYEFDPAGPITIRPHEPDLSRSGLPPQVLDVLRSGAKTIGEIAEELDASRAGVKKVLQRLENRDKVVRLTGTHGGRGKEVQWGLAVTTGT